MKKACLAFFGAFAFCIFYSICFFPANLEATIKNNSADLVLGQPNFTSNAAVYYPCTAASFAEYPTGLANDGAGNVWVVDNSNNRVLKFTNPTINGQAASVVLGQPNFVLNTCTDSFMEDLYGISVCYPAIPPAGFCGPYGVAIDTATRRIYVTDIDNNRVLWWNNSESLTNGQAADGVLGQPDYLNADPNHNPNDPDDNPSGADYWTFESSPNQTGLCGPSGIAVDNSGNVWVADTVNNRVLKYTRPTANGQPAILVLGQQNFTSNSSADTQTGMYSPMGVYVDSSGNAWVSDINNNRVLKFDYPQTNGQAASLVISGLNNPRSVTGDSAGNIWIADSWNDRVLKFDNPTNSVQSPSLILGPALKNTPLLGLVYPIAVSLDGSGNLWVVDSENNRALKFNAVNPITSLAVAAWVGDNPSPAPVSSGTVQLTWTAPADIGTGQGYQYQIWYATYPFTASTLPPTSQIKPTAAPALAVDSFTVTGLGQGTQYYFGIEDVSSGAYSPLSNAATGQTLLDVPLMSQTSGFYINSVGKLDNWANDIYDDYKPRTIYNKGCALTCMTMIIDYYSLHHPTETLRGSITYTNPGTLNTWLNTHNGYSTSTHTVDFAKIALYTNKTVRYTVQSNIPMDINLNPDIIKDQPPILEVWNVNHYHYVVAIGTCTPVGCIINDPGYKQGKTLNNTYGNTYSGLREFAPANPNEPFHRLIIRGSTQ